MTTPSSQTDQPLTITSTNLTWPRMTVINALKSKEIGVKDIKEELWPYTLWVNLMKHLKTMNWDNNLTQKTLKLNKVMKSAFKIKKLLKKKRKACLVHKLWLN
jgi:hypothetical protein